MQRTAGRTAAISRQRPRFQARSALKEQSTLPSVSYAVCVDQPGFAPRPFVRKQRGHGTYAGAPFRGARRIGRDVQDGDGRKDHTGLRWEPGRRPGDCPGPSGAEQEAWTPRPRCDLNEPGGIGISFTGAFQETRRSPRLCLESRLGSLGDGSMVLTVLAGLHLEWKDARLSLESGMEEWTRLHRRRGSDQAFPSARLMEHAVHPGKVESCAHGQRTVLPLSHQEHFPLELEAALTADLVLHQLYQGKDVPRRGASRC